MQNPADAEAWLAQTPALSAEAKAKILERGNRVSTQFIQTFSE